MRACLCARVRAPRELTRPPPSPHTRWALTAPGAQHALAQPAHTCIRHAAQQSASPVRTGHGPDCTHMPRHFLLRPSTALLDTHSARTPPHPTPHTQRTLSGAPSSISSSAKPSGRQFTGMILRNNLISTIIHKQEPSWGHPETPQPRPPLLRPPAKGEGQEALPHYSPFPLGLPSGVGK